MAVERNIRGEEFESPLFRVAGGSYIPMPIQGQQGIISTSDAIAQEVKKGISELTVVLSRTQANSQDELREMVGLLKDLREVQMMAAQSTVAGAMQAGVPAPPIPGSTTSGRGLAAVPDAPPAAPDVWSEYESRRNFFGSGGRPTISNLRQALGERLQDRYGNLDLTDSTGVVRVGENTFREASTGQILPQSDERVQGYLQREMVQGALRGGIESLASGGSIRQAAGRAAGAIPGGATLLRGAGWVGAGAMLLNSGLDWFEGQRAQQAEWMAMTGGSQADAIGERMGQVGFRWGNRGLLSKEDSDSLYRGVAAAGFQGDERTAMQDFALDAYRTTGMSIQDSLKLIRQAGVMGASSLDGVVGALKRVSDTAREAGSSIPLATKSLLEAHAAATAQFGPGKHATVLAEGITTAFEAMGQEGVDPTGMFGDSMLHMIGAQTGLTPNELRLMQMNDPTSYTNLLEQNLGTSIDLHFPGLRAHLSRLGIRPDSSNEEKYEAALKYPGFSNISYVASILRNMGVTFENGADPFSVGVALVNIALGINLTDATRTATTDLEEEEIRPHAEAAERLNIHRQSGGLRGGRLESQMTPEAWDIYEDISKTPLEANKVVQDAWTQHKENAARAIMGETGDTVTGQGGLGGSASAPSGDRSDRVMIGLTPDAQRLLEVISEGRRGRYDKNLSPDDPHANEVDEINIVNLPSSLDRNRVIDLVAAVTSRTDITLEFKDALDTDSSSGLKVAGRAYGDHTAVIQVKDNVLSMEVSILHEVSHLVNEGVKHGQPWCDTFWNALQKMIPDQYSLWTQYHKMAGGYGCVMPPWAGA